MPSILFLAQANISDIAVETGRQFGFAWPLFISQCLSFIIVCILLQKFAYKPVLTVLEQRREKIRQSLENADKIKQQLAEAERRHEEILQKANQEAQRMIDDARASAETIASRKQQEAISQAEQIIIKAREATQMEHDRMMAELRGEVGRLVVDTTTKVTGKILTPEDQQRLTEETARQVAA